MPKLEAFAQPAPLAIRHIDAAERQPFTNEHGGAITGRLTKL
jgi:hypothetical protein